MFNQEDTSYLSGHLNREQLLHEIHSAEVREGVARMWAEDADVIYWREFGMVCQRALQEHKKMQSKHMTGKSSVKAMKEAHNIIDVISRYSALRRTGKEYTGSCPFHEDRQPSLRISDEKQIFYCFSCGRKGDVIDFLGEIENLDVKGVCRLLAGK